MVDVAVIGGGPAGLSAAINVCARGRSCVILSNDVEKNPLAASPCIENYAGLRGVTGLALLKKMKAEADEAGALWQTGHVLSVMKLRDRFMIGVGSEIVEARRVILATGIRLPQPIPGEMALLGRGVSYCATCDGALYRGKQAIVIGNADDLPSEAAMLSRIGVSVTVMGASRPSELSDDIPFVQAKRFALEKGSETPVTLVADGQAVACDVVFVLRDAVAAEALVPGLALHDRFVAVDAAGQTNISGLFAAGDCTGKPLQIAKAVGQGLLAAWSATDSLL